MDLIFLNQLTEEDMIQLFNYVLDNEEEEINIIKGYNEDRRQTVNGGEYYFFETWQTAGIPISIGNFNVSDFNIKYWNGVNSIPNDQSNYIKRFREFMASKFGIDYINALYEYHVENAEKEKNELLAKNNSFKKD